MDKFVIYDGKFKLDVYDKTWDKITEYCLTTFRTDITNEPSINLADLDLKNIIKLL